MIKLTVASCFLFIGTIVSFYSIKVLDINDNFINLSKYANKKVLLVNIASGSNQVSQLSQLQQLYMKHKDSFVVIAFPSNSFGKEPKTDADIKIFLNGYGITFPIASKSMVHGNNANILYKWLESKLQNETMNAKISTDFQKYLIDKKGKIVAVFDSSIKPLSTQVQNAIKNN
jgi:glutathione peroxidase